MKITWSDLPTLRPEQLTDAVCKDIWVTFYQANASGGGFFYDEDLEREKLATMLPESAKVFIDWRTRYDQKDKQTKQYATTTKNGKVVPKEQYKPIKLIDACDLVNMDIPPLQWLVKDILPKESVCMIVAPPKSYKSFLCIDLCLSLVYGKKFLSRETTKCEVLYFDLESTLRRPKERIELITKSKSIPPGFYIYTAEIEQTMQIGNGFEKTISQVFEEHPQIELVIVDVFQIIRQKHSKAQNAYDADYEDLKVIKRLATQYKTSFLLVHHSRKMKDLQDVYNNASGSSAMLGAVDCMLMIDKDKRSDAEATFYFTGRDIDNLDLRMRFNLDTFTWDYIGTPIEVARQRREQAYKESAVINAIKKLLASNNGQWNGTATQLKDISVYFTDCRIYDDTRIISRTIKEYTDLLKEENIIYSYGRVKDRSRVKEYNFVQR